MNNSEIPLLLKRCLTYGVIILPYQLNIILNQSESKIIPDEILSKLNKLELEKYVKGLWLCGQEMSRDWSKGHELLKELGFEETTTTEGHRSFVSLIFKK